MIVKKHIHVIDGARGFAAYYILFHHALFLIGQGKYFSNNWAVRLIHDFSAGFTVHILMLFFLLSGFSIHYANYGRIQSFRWAALQDYYYKRVRRIYPIYLLAIALSLAAIAILQQLQPDKGWEFPGRSQLFGVVAFFSDLASRSGTWIPTLSTNGPLWSLSYEVLYYFLYPLFSVIAIRRGGFASLFMATFVSVVAVLTATLYGPTQITNMLSLYILWCLGALIATLKIQNYRLPIKPLYVFLIIFAWAQGSWIFATFLLWHVPMAFHLYIGLFIFFVMFCGAAGALPAVWQARERIIAVVFAVGCSSAALYLAHRLKVTDNMRFLSVRVGLTLILGLLWLSCKPVSLFDWIKRFFNLWHDTGAYSYALYILQFPIMIVAYVAAEKYLGSAFFGMVAIGLVIVVAKLVELKLQPRIARYLDSVLRSKPLMPVKSSPG